VEYSFNDDMESIEFVLNQLRTNYNLTDWEDDFVLSAFEQFHDKGDLSDKQLGILSNLWEKY